MRRVLSLLYFAYFFASSALFVCISALLCLICKDRDPNRRPVHRFSCWWGYHYIAVNPFWTCKFEGRENLPQDSACVLVANHQSFWDIMVLYGLNYPYKWVSKESIFKVPFIGWNMMLNQYVKIARGDLKSIKEMMTCCKNWLKQGASIMIFPEGTRSADGRLLEFRDGPFKMASDCKLPVVPIVVEGTHLMFPKGSLEVNFRANVRVRILPPVYPENFDQSPRKLREHVRAQMVSCLSELREQTPEEVDSLASGKLGNQQIAQGKVQQEVPEKVATLSC